MAAALLAGVAVLLPGGVLAGGAVSGSALSGSGAAGGTESARTVASVSGTWAPALNRDFPDPDVFAWGGSYYAYATEVGGDNVPLAESSDGLTWRPQVTDAMPALAPWVERGNDWAPTVARNAQGQFVMYYVAQDAGNGLECIGRALSASPTGPFVDGSAQPVLCDPSMGGDIDPDLFTDPSGTSYLLFKNDGNRIASISNLWSVALDGSLSIAGTPTLLLTADRGWQEGIVEGPDLVDVGGTYDLLYGGGSYQDDTYAIGMATCASPLGPCVDRPGPVLGTHPGLSGPGGPSVFATASGQLLVAFDAWTGGFAYPRAYRPMYVASLTFTGGVPTFTPSTPSPPGGTWEVASDGGAFAFGVPYHGSMGGHPLNATIVGMAPTPNGAGYWEVASDGGVFAFGDAGFDGSMGGTHLNAPVVGMAPTPDGGGYWLVASDGGVFAFGDAGFEGSMGGAHVNAPVVGMAPDAETGGYWLVASDGGIFAFDAAFEGSASGQTASPVVGMAVSPDDHGYWLAAADGTVFAEGPGAPFEGSMGGQPLDAPVVAIVATTDGGGYQLAASDGGLFSFGDAGFFGSMGGHPLDAPIVGLADVSG